MSSKTARFPIPFLLFTVTAGLFVWSVLRSAPLLPERVATHFDLQGQPNGWMSPEQHVRFLLGFGLGLAVFLAELCHLIRFLPSRFLNVPNPEFWRSPEHYPVACGIVARWSWLVAAFQLIFLGLLNDSLVAANQLSPPRLSTAGLYFPTGIFLCGLAVLVWGLFRFLRRARAGLGSLSS